VQCDVYLMRPDSLLCKIKSHGVNSQHLEQEDPMINLSFSTVVFKSLRIVLCVYTSKFKKKKFLIYVDRYTHL